MTIIRAYGNPFEVIDRTEQLLTIPNSWGLFNSLGLFESEGVSSDTVSLENIIESAVLIKDRVRGQRNNYSKDYTRTLRSFAIPHFNFDEYITPEDIKGKIAYGSEGVDTLAAARLRKMERIRKSWAWTQEAAKAQLITTGTMYAPNSTVSINYYTEFGITRKEVDFVLGTSTTNIIAKGEEARADILERMNSGEVVSEFVAVCSPVFFNKLIAHAKVESAYNYYASTQEPLRRRLDAAGLDARFREFNYGGIRYIEYPGSFNGTALIPSGDAYLFPVGTSDTFRTYFGPAMKFDLVNTIGQEAYMFEYASPKGDKIEIETESNFLHALRRPAAVARLYSSN